MRIHQTLGILLIGVLACSEDPTGPGLVPSSLEITHVSQIDPGGGQVGYSDIWGYVDGATGREYALLGTRTAMRMYVMDVSDPAAPSTVATVAVPSFDMKTWGKYAYTVTGSGDGGTDLGRIVDLSDPTDPVVVGSFPSSHNLFIDERGFMYLEIPGLRIYDLNADPEDPGFVWATNTTGGHDATVVGDRLYDFHGGGTNIYDIRDRAQPQLLSPVSHPAISYHHNGWPSTDGRYLFITDELASGSTADVTIWDITQVDDPIMAATISDPSATVHNVFVVGDMLFASYYTAGFRVFDVSNPGEPGLVYEHDTAPVSGEGWDGAWGVYPFAPSGNVYVSDMRSGLHVFTVSTR